MLASHQTAVTSDMTEVTSLKVSVERCPVHTLISSARIIDTSTGCVVARVEHHETRKEPMRADRECGGRGYFVGNVTPLAARSILDDLTGQLK